MELLKEIANFSGKSGLYRILKPGRGGVIVESLDGKREKSMIGASARVSVLKDISIFMATKKKQLLWQQYLQIFIANTKTKFWRQNQCQIISW